MYDFSFSEEEELVADTAVQFAVRELRPRMRAHEDDGVDAGVQAAFDEIGLAEAAELGAVSQARVLEALAWGDAGAAMALMSPALSAQVCEPLGAPPATCIHVVEDLVDESVRVNWIPGPAEPTLLVFDPKGRWRLGGADLQPARGLGLHAAGGAAGVLAAGGPTGKGDGAQALATLHRAAGAMLAGLARAALEYTSEYVQERTSFGKRLADHQGLAFLISDMAIRTEAARWTVYAACWSGEAERAADAWRIAAEAACWVTDHGVQLLGGHGYMKAHPVEKFMRDARALALCWGGRDLAWT